MKWYPKHFDRATELLNEGCSYQVVADTLTEEFNEEFSYNAVLQKVQTGEIDSNSKERSYTIRRTTKDNRVSQSTKHTKQHN